MGQGYPRPPLVIYLHVDEVPEPAAPNVPAVRGDVQRVTRIVHCHARNQRPRGKGIRHDCHVSRPPSSAVLLVIVLDLSDVSQNDPPSGPGEYSRETGLNDSRGCDHHRGAPCSPLILGVCIPWLQVVPDPSCVYVATVIHCSCYLMGMPSVLHSHFGGDCVFCPTVPPIKGTVYCRTFT